MERTTELKPAQALTRVDAVSSQACFGHPVERAAGTPGGVILHDFRRRQVGYEYGCIREGQIIAPGGGC